MGDVVIVMGVDMAIAEAADQVVAGSPFHLADRGVEEGEERLILML